MDDDAELRELAEEKAAAESRFNGLMLGNVARDPVARVEQEMTVAKALIRLNKARSALDAYIKRASGA